MDDQFNQWCMNRYLRDPENMTATDRRILRSEYDIERLDAEILELKRRIEILETPKNV